MGECVELFLFLISRSYLIFPLATFSFVVLFFLYLPFHLPS